MNITNTISLKQLLLCASAVGLALFASSQSLAAIGSGGWALNKVGAGSAQAYCTISQNFVEQGVVTLGQTPRGEYSLAFDASSKLFTAGKAQSIALKTSKIPAQNFLVTPQSDKVAVLNLGTNNQLWMSFHSGDDLTLGVAGKEHKFTPSQTGRAQKDMMDCITSLKSPPKATSTASVAPLQPASSISNEQLAVNEENAKLRQALQESRQQLEQTRATSGSNARTNELADKVRLLELENAELKSAGGAVQAGKTSPELARLQAELSALTQQKSELQTQLAQRSTSPQVSTAQLDLLAKENADLKLKLETASKSTPDNNQIIQERDGLKAQLAQLQNQLNQVRTQSGKITANDMKLADLQKENADIKARLEAANRQSTVKNNGAEFAKISAERDGLKSQLAQTNLQVAELQKQSVERTTGKTNSPELQKKLAELELENSTLKTNLSNSKFPTVTVNPSAKVQVDQLKAELETVRAKNAQLQSDLANRQMANVSTTSAAQNFDLAQATKRYEEAQREIRRLGSIIQAQESKHVAEKREIEGMLFDPAIASSAQVALKESYEQRINALEGQLKSKGIEPSPVASADIQATAKMIEPSSGRDLPRPVMASGYGVIKSSEPPPPPSMIPPISEAEVTRDMMPLPVPTMAAAPTIQQVPVERIIERVVEKSDPQKDAQIAQISKELQALRKNQEQQTLENAQLRSELLQKQKAKEELGLNMMEASRMAEEPKQRAAQAQAKIKEQANIESIPLPTPVTPPIARPNFMAESEVSSLLKRAGVSLSNSVSYMGDGNDTYKAFRWKSGELFGSSEQRIVNSSSDYQSAIAAYMDRARARCKGDFASEPTGLSASVPNGQGYEIACVGEKINSTASVMFSYSDRIMTTIAHEGKAEVMGDAMNIRDKIANVFSSMITASR